MVYGLLNQPPRRLPFSDWKARVERVCDRHPDWETAQPFLEDDRILHAYYDNGVPAAVCAADLVQP